MPSPVMAMRRGRALGSGSAYSRTASVFGSMAAILLVPNRATNGMPFGLTMMP
ncbi:hypothetical protein D3C83_94930 [compost metagenome]